MNILLNAFECAYTSEWMAIPLAHAAVAFDAVYDHIRGRRRCLHG